ncbi:hypothetical protein F503_04337 [Ophiostoma piceae UAMH 11346]|uniref:2EXR domain-containing protein n=1 Tax=Ophiostoma piceae (strain UAMH 11346) TaxID=1262450 RepID=S3D5T9_OPHP1|nr:hypothetical protein F503_04337 [Ophiostoma piceae UAMH 11346]
MLHMLSFLGSRLMAVQLPAPLCSTQEMGDAYIHPGRPILPEDILSARESDYQRRPHVLQPRVSQRRRFWLEFSVLPHYPSRKTLKIQRKLEKKHRAKDKTSNDYDLHDVPAIRFPQFGRLPPEIRLVIWEYALCQPRIVVITSKYEDYTPPVGTTLDPLTSNNYLNAAVNGFQNPVLTSLPPLSPPPPPWTPPSAELPALMVACRESYECAVKFYERAFDWRVPHVLVDEDGGDDTFVATRGYYAGRALGFFGQPQASSSPDSTQQGQQQQQQQRLQNLPPLSSVLGSRYRVRPGSTPMQRPAAKRLRPSGPGCWFNFEYDSVFLKGELEPCLEAASTSMVYFMPLLDTKRVRYVACNADDLGVGELMASQLYARLFPVIDRFEIKKCLNIVSPPRIRKQKTRVQSEDEARAATEALTTAANIVVTQRNPSGIGYESDGRQRLSDTQASCMSVNASDINQYAGDMNGLESYDMSNNVCQQVWDQWTNSQNTPRLKAGSQTRSAAHPRGDGSYASDSDSESDSESECSCDCDIENAITADSKPSTNMALDHDDGEGYGLGINVTVAAERDDRDDEGEVGADRTGGTTDDEMEDADGMDVDASPDAAPAEWPPRDWDTLPAPSENYGDAALHGLVPNAQNRDGAPPQDTMRIVMVTEDLLHGTIATIEKVRLYASKFGKDI